MADVKKILVRIGATTQELDRKLGESQNKINAFSKQINKIGGLIAGAFAVSKIARFASEASRLAGEAEGVGHAFKRIADANFLEKLRQATSGTVSDLELMRKTVQANNFKLPLENLPKLFEFARRRAQETGESVDYLVRSIVLGIGRKSPLILDNLGISAIELRKRLKGVGVEAASVADVTKIIGEIAEEAIGKMGDEILTSKDRTEQLQAAWENTKVTFGESVNIFKDGLIPYLNQAIEKFGKLIKINGLFLKYGHEGAMAYQQAEQEISTEIDHQANLLVKMGKMRDFESAKLFVISKYIKTYTEILKTSRAEDEYQSKVWQFKLDMLKEMIIAFANNNDEIEEQIGLIPKLEKNIEKLQKKIENTFDPKLIAQFNTEIQKLKVQITNLQDGIKFDDDKLFFRRKNTRDLADFRNQVDEVNRSLGITKDEKIPGARKEIRGLSKEELIFAENLTNVTSEFSNMAEGMGEGFDEFASNFGNTVKKIIGALLGWAVGEMIVKGIKASETAGPLALFLAPALGAAGAGIAKALFSSLVPSFAGGGLVTAPTLAMVGDNPSHREAIIPLDQGMGFGGGRFEIVGKVRGKDLYWSLKNYEQFLQNT